MNFTYHNLICMELQIMNISNSKLESSNESIPCIYCFGTSQCLSNIEAHFGVRRAKGAQNLNKN